MNSQAEYGGFAERRLTDVAGDLPLVNPRYIGRDYRYAYIAMIDPSRRMHKAGPTQMASNLIGKLDVMDGSVQSYYGGGLRRAPHRPRSARYGKATAAASERLSHDLGAACDEVGNLS